MKAAKKLISTQEAKKQGLTIVKLHGSSALYAGKNLEMNSSVNTEGRMYRSVVKIYSKPRKSTCVIVCE